MAKYKNFDEYVDGERIVRWVEYFRRCWNFATDAAEEKFNSKQQPHAVNPTGNADDSTAA